MLRADSGYPHNFMVNSWVSKDDESKSDAKTNSKHWGCLLLVGSSLLAWRVHAHSPLLAHCVHTHKQTHTLSLYHCRPLAPNSKFLTTILKLFIGNSAQRPWSRMPRPPARLGSPTWAGGTEHLFPIFYYYYQLLSVFTNSIVKVGVVPACFLNIRRHVHCKRYITTFNFSRKTFNFSRKTFNFLWKTVTIAKGNFRNRRRRCRQYRDLYKNI